MKFSLVAMEQLLIVSQTQPGVDTGPNALIGAGLLDQLRDDLGYKLHHDQKVHTYPELMVESDADHRGMKNPRAVSAVTRKLAEQIYEHASHGRMVLTLGGDHSIAIGTISGTAKAIRERLGKEIAVIWVDAHTDINTPETSGSGNIHGMPVAFLTGLAKETDPDLFGWVGADSSLKTNGSEANGYGHETRNGNEPPHPYNGVLSLKKLVYIGLRDVDRGEKQILRKHGIKAFSMHDVDKYAYPTTEAKSR